jgi:hypothetical protein
MENTRGFINTGKIKFVSSFSLKGPVADCQNKGKGKHSIAKPAGKAVQMSRPTIACRGQAIRNRAGL